MQILAAVQFALNPESGRTASILPTWTPTSNIATCPSRLQWTCCYWAHLGLAGSNQRATRPHALHYLRCRPDQHSPSLLQTAPLRTARICGNCCHCLSQDAGPVGHPISTTIISGSAASTLSTAKLAAPGFGNYRRTLSAPQCPNAYSPIN